MATINPVATTIVGATVSRVASTPAGDVVPYTGGDLLLHFENGHASSVTVSFVPTQSTIKAPGVGNVTVPTRTIAIATGAEAAFIFRSDEVSAYVDGNRQIPISYTGGNALLTVMALRV